MKSKLYFACIALGAILPITFCQYSIVFVWHCHLYRNHYLQHHHTKHHYPFLLLFIIITTTPPPSSSIASSFLAISWWVYLDGHAFHIKTGITTLFLHFFLPYAKISIYYNYYRISFPQIRIIINMSNTAIKV